LSDLRVHDLRRTFGSWQALRGVSLQVIGATLGHRSLESTKRYARLTREPVVAAVDSTTSALLAATKQSKRRKAAANGKAR
jgi:integrase